MKIVLLLWSAVLGLSATPSRGTVEGPESPLDPVLAATIDSLVSYCDSLGVAVTSTRSRSALSCSTSVQIHGSELWRLGQDVESWLASRGWSRSLLSNWVGPGGVVFTWSRGDYSCETNSVTLPLVAGPPPPLWNGPCYHAFSVSFCVDSAREQRE